MRLLRHWLLLGSITLLLPAYGQTSLSPRPDTTAAPPPAAAPAGEVDDFGDEEDAAAGTAVSGKKTTAGTSNGCCEKKPFRLSPRHTWDVNVDATFLLPRYVTYNLNGLVGYNFYYGGVSPLAAPFVQPAGSSTLLVRRNMTSRKKGGQGVRRGAYRYGLTLGLDLAGTQSDTIRSDRSLFTFGYFTHQASSLVGGRFGYERQEQFGRFQFSYGYDLGLFHRWQQQRLLTTYVNDNFRTEETNFWARAVGATAAAVGAVRFYLHPRVSLALESRFELIYSHQRSAGLGPQFDPTSDYRIGARPFRSWFFSQRFVPLSGLYLAFHLGKPVRVK